MNDTMYDLIDNIYNLETELYTLELNESFTEWLFDNGYYYDELLESRSESSQWYLNFKNKVTNSLKNSLAQMKQHAMSQLNSDGKWLEQYKNIILNQKQYPVKPNVNMNNVTNYQAALQRIARPISTALNGIDLNKIDTDNKNNTNGWLKHYLIPTYTNQNNFTQYAKAYFYGGEGKKVNLKPQQVGKLLQSAYQFCSNYISRIQNCETELQAIVNYVNRDPSTGQIQQATQADLNKIQAAQYNKSSNSNNRNPLTNIASTNPNANVGVTNNIKRLNADTNIDIFMNDYFSDILNEDQPTNNMNTTQQPSNNTPLYNKNAVSANTHQNSSLVSNKAKQNPNGAPVDSRALAYKKKQVVCDIVKDCFNAKLAAIGMLYRDFIYMQRLHVASYKGSKAGNTGQRPQQVTQQPNQQQNQQMNQQKQVNTNQQQPQRKMMMQM